jgi:hypothetical protein
VARTIETLFAGLEHEDHITFKMIAMSTQDPCSTQEHRNMQIVTACMHNAVNATLVIDFIELLNWKRVHVRSKKHRSISTISAKNRCYGS